MKQPNLNRLSGHISSASAHPAQSTAWLNRLATLAVLLIALMLAACGGSAKRETSKDGSADYRNAVSLPPLKKPSRVLQDGSDNTGAPVIPAEVTQRAPSENAVAAAPTSVSPSNSATNSQPQASTRQVVSASIVSPEEGVARLQIEQSFDVAWSYLEQQLRTSGLTVFSRNKSAGRILIGCEALENAPTVVRKGRWSFRRANKVEQLEHCALQTLSDDERTRVSLINRTGQEIGKQSAEQIFQRLLNN